MYIVKWIDYLKSEEVENECIKRVKMRLGE